MTGWIRMAVFVPCVVATALGGCADSTAQKDVEVAAPAAAVSEAMQSLSEEDRQSALRQRICPVSEEPLGSMGPPVKVVVGEQEIWICCDSCEELLKADPQSYLEKLQSP